MAETILFSYQSATASHMTQSISGGISPEQHQRILQILDEGRPDDEPRFAPAPPFVTVPIPCISYKHMHPDTSIWLQCALDDSRMMEPPGFIAAMVEGTCFLIAPSEGREEYAEDLQAIFAWADKHATHGWIMLDNDGDVQPDLLTY